MNARIFFTLFYICAMPSMVILLLVGIELLCRISPRFDKALMHFFDIVTK